MARSLILLAADVPREEEAGITGGTCRGAPGDDDNC